MKFTSVFAGLVLVSSNTLDPFEVVGDRAGRPGGRYSASAVQLEVKNS